MKNDGKRHIYINRLLYLAGEVAKEKTKRFDFGHYVGADWRGDPKLSCGTIRCAIGLASTLPRFRRLGLELRFWHLIRTVFPYIKGRANPVIGVPEIFGLSLEEYNALFVPSNAPNYLDGEATAKEVAAQIRDFVEAAKEGEEASWLEA